MTIVPKFQREATRGSFGAKAPTPADMSAPGPSGDAEAQSKPWPIREILSELDDPDAEDLAEPSSEKDVGLAMPKLRLEIRDLNHPGAAKFLAAVNASEVLRTAVHNVQHHLYHDDAPKDKEAKRDGNNSQSRRRYRPPPTRSVTVVLRDMGGVAYTTGTELDPEHHKEIHVSLPYLSSVHGTITNTNSESPAPSRLAAEATGVLTHELVHCYQWNAQGTCPGGLIEGIADWVRLQCGLSPPHWKREVGGGTRWDSGYQHTAYFLDYLETRFGSGTVRRINARLRNRRYQEAEFWTGLFRRPVEQLWEDYVAKVGEEARRAEADKTGHLCDEGIQASKTYK
ncbi:hypothetical protein VTK73DRAFT_1623 [Phialemonium thermophilum]|uniref:Uncharacterized protein n=1 Tax=Phialemonium thermophilum TaxID=223376 RepID=A0ABR3X8N3_9PEZI